MPHDKSSQHPGPNARISKLELSINALCRRTGHTGAGRRSAERRVGHIGTPRIAQDRFIGIGGQPARGRNRGHEPEYSKDHCGSGKANHRKYKIWGNCGAKNGTEPKGRAKHGQCLDPLFAARANCNNGLCGRRCCRAKQTVNDPCADHRYHRGNRADPAQ